MARDRSKFNKMKEFDLYDFARWILEDLDKLKKKPDNLDTAWLHYQFQQEKKIITLINYKYWVVWSDKHKEKSFSLYPCHTLILEQRRAKDKSFEDAH